jgi:hypothetical protein
VIVEQRRYTLVPGGATPYLRQWHETGRPVQVRHLGDPVGVFTVEIGILNTLVFLWQYSGPEDRDRRRRRLADDPEFARFRRGVRELVVSQHSEILSPAPAPAREEET